VKAVADPVGRPRLRRAMRLVGGLTGCALLAAVLFMLAALAMAWTAMGHAPTARDVSQFPSSDHRRGDHFFNLQPAWVDQSGVSSRGFSGDGTQQVSPNTPVPIVHPDRATFARLPVSGLRLTWFGHSSTLVEMDGVRILTDPLLSARASPLQWIGPSTWYPLPFAMLPPIDAVVISHDHYDHLDRTAIVALGKGRARFFVPLGVGAHLRFWGIPADRIVELDWWQSARIGDVGIVATPARHTSGRVRPGSDQTLWAGYAIIGPRHRVWYSGDTGFHDALRTIGTRLGPFDVTLLDAGQYSRLWPDHHLGPEMAVVAHRLVRGVALMPIHWGRVQLADHGWTEPVERTLAAARCAGVRVLTPRPGEAIEPQRQPGATRWWPKTEWQRARAAPVRPTRGGSPNHLYPLPDCF